MHIIDGECWLVVLGVIAFFILLALALCDTSGRAEDIEEYQRKEGQTDEGAGLFGTDKKTGQDDQKQTE